jgi:hypothetical protein
LEKKALGTFPLAGNPGEAVISSQAGADKHGRKELYRMTTASITAGLPPEQILAESRSTYRLQQSVLRALDTLSRLNAEQRVMQSARSWEQLIRRKQLLLDGLEQVSIGVLMHQAQQLAELLVECEQWQLAEGLQENARTIREKFLALAEHEHLTQQQLQQYIDNLPHIPVRMMVVPAGKHGL